MFEKNRNNQEPDALDERIHGLRNGLRASAKLKAAAIDGEWIAPVVQTRTHVWRFTKAVAAYALGVMLLLGVVAVLPAIWESGLVSSPGTNMTTTPALTNGTDLSTPPEGSNSANVTDAPAIDPTPDTEDNSDVIVGPMIEFNLLRPSMKEFVEFYTVFQRKNVAPIVVTDLGDQENSITQYHFYGGIINIDTFPDDYDYDYSSGGPFVSGEQPIPIHFWYSFYYNCDDAYFGTYDYGIVAENYTLDNYAVIDLDNIRLERVSTGLETFSAKHELSAKGKKEGEIRYYEIYSGEHRLMKFAICAVASTEDSYYDSICQQVVDGLVKLG